MFPQTAQPQGEAPPPPAPVAGGYPYGYGYGYAPAPVDPRRDKTLSELQQVDVRIASVRKQQKQYSIAGPLAMTATGYGFAAIAGLVAVFSWVNAEDIQSGDCPYSYRRNNRCDIDDDGVIDKHDERDARILARTFGAISALGAGVGIAGTVLLMKRLAKRRQYGPELDELGTRRGQLLHELRYGGGYSQNGGLQLNVSGRF